MTEQAKKAVAYTVATHAVERMKPSREALRLCNQVAAGRLSADHAVEQIKRKYGVKERS